jgi:hypothetical protein
MGTQQPPRSGGEPAETAKGNPHRLHDADGTDDPVTDRQPLPDAVAPGVLSSSQVYRAANAGAPGPPGSAAGASSADATSSLWAHGVQIAWPVAVPEAEPADDGLPPAETPIEEPITPHPSPGARRHDPPEDTRHARNLPADEPAARFQQRERPAHYAPGVGQQTPTSPLDPIHPYIAPPVARRRRSDWTVMIFGMVVVAIVLVGFCLAGFAIYSAIGNPFSK